MSAKLKTRRKRKRRRIKPDSKLGRELRKRITPPGLPKPKVNPKHRSRYMAWRASHDLRSHAYQIRDAALARDKLFFRYLADFLKGEPILLPLNEDQQKFIALAFFHIPKLSDGEIRKKLGLSGRQNYYRQLKLQAIKRYRQCQQAWRRGWLDELRDLFALEKKMFAGSINQQQ